MSVSSLTRHLTTTQVIHIPEARRAGDTASAPAGPPPYVRLGAVAVDRTGSAYETYDDPSLGKLIAERDALALEELYDRHGGACYGLARRVVGDDQLAQDVVQEVFLAIWRRVPRPTTARAARSAPGCLL